MIILWDEIKEERLKKLELDYEHIVWTCQKAVRKLEMYKETKDESYLEKAIDILDNMQLQDVGREIGEGE